MTERHFDREERENTHFCEVARYWQRQTACACRLRCRNYFDYVRLLWRSTAAFGWYRAARTFYRRYRLVRLIWRLVQTLFWMLQTGTLLLLLLPVFLVFLPGFLLLMLLMLVGGVLDLRRWRSTLAERMQDRTVVLLNAPEEVLTRGGTVGETDTFFRAQVRDLCARGKALVIVRSPYLFSARGLGGRGFYWMIRREAANCYLTRSLGFFALRKTACDCAAKLIFVA